MADLEGIGGGETFAPPLIEKNVYFFFMIFDIFTNFTPTKFCHITLSN